MSKTFLARRPRPRLADASFAGYSPQDLWSAYRFPPHDGSGVAIGLAEWRSGYAQSDVDAFCANTGLPPCKPLFRSVDGTANDEGRQPYDMEATLDVEWAHAAAPGARIIVYECNPGATMAEFGEAMHRLFRFVLADPDRPQILSVSYGEAETDWPASLVEQWEADVAALTAAGCHVFVSSGDQGVYGSHDLSLPRIVRADAPASLPSAVSVGGTTLPAGDPAQEYVWGGASGDGATGGGFSSIFERPPYQATVSQHPMRGYPDLCAVADPATGYYVVFEGVPQVIGGTSASCPLVAGLFARLMQARREAGLPPLTDLHSLIYQHPEAFRDITFGINSYLGVVGYRAEKGWDAASGMGAPLGDALLDIIAPRAAAPPVDRTHPTISVNGKAVESGVIRGGTTYAPGSRILAAMGDPPLPVRLFVEAVPGATIRSASTATGEEILIETGTANTAAQQVLRPKRRLWRRILEALTGRRKA